MYKVVIQSLPEGSDCRCRWCESAAVWAVNDIICCEEHKDLALYLEARF